MKFAVIGCGNVGFAFLSWLHSKGYNVVGYDINLEVQSKIITKLGKKTLSVDYQDLTLCDAIFICVPTEPLRDGRADMSTFESVLDNIRSHIGEKKIAIIQRSTCPPGSADKYADLFGENVSYAVNPSFLRKSSIEYDTAHPDRIAIGGSGLAKDLLMQVYSDIESPRIISSSRTSIELLKYIENTTDAMLISYWNEILAYAVRLGIKEEEFISLLEKLGDKDKFKSTVRIPGMAFGLWCLPKDLLAIILDMEDKGLHPNVLRGIYETNTLINSTIGTGVTPAQELISFDNGSVMVLQKGQEQISRFYEITTK